MQLTPREKDKLMVAMAAEIARKRGGLVEHWSKAKGAPKPLLPIGDLLSDRERRRVFQ